MSTKYYHKPENKVYIYFHQGSSLTGLIESIDFSKRYLSVYPVDEAGNEKTYKNEYEFKDIFEVIFVRQWSHHVPSFRKNLSFIKKFLDVYSYGVLKVKKVQGKWEKDFQIGSMDFGGIFVVLEEKVSNIIEVFIPNAPEVQDYKEGDKIGDTLVKEGMITQQELVNGLEKQKELKNRPLGEFFVEQGLLDRPELRKALDRQQKKSDKIGDILLAAGAITNNQLEEALEIQKKDRQKRLGQILIDMNIINEDMLTLALSLRFGLPYIDLNHYNIDPQSIEQVDPEIARRFNALPIELSGETLTVAFSDPTDLDPQKDLSFHTGLEIKEVLASKEAIRQKIEELYGKEDYQNFKKLLGDVDVEEVRETPSFEYDISENMGKEKPIIELVNHIFVNGLRNNASDIHILPEEKRVSVLYRVDGVLQKEMNLPIDRLPSVIARMKIMSNMNIAERRLPQDGRTKIKIGQKIVDLRFSCIPTIYGESIVVRILDKESGVMNLDHLGLYPKELKELRNCINKQYGMILMTGPTGSGKSSTIYSSLQENVFEQKNVVTLEDPVEYELPGISQIQIKEGIGLTFAQGLRQILRHDPDVIIVGEIRDMETAKISIQSALTGHLLFSTLHTNTAASSYIRLIEMGVEPYLVSTSILGILSQRLVRKICNSCKKEDQSALDKLRDSNFPVKSTEDTVFYKGKGCKECNFTGYKGRTLIYEFLVPKEKVKRAAMKKDSTFEIRQIAIENGMNPMESIALQKAEEGITTVDEIIPLESELELNDEQ